MVRGIAGNTRPRRVPEELQRHMRRRFMWTMEYIKTLRCFGHDAVFHDEAVKRVRVFDPAVAKRLDLTVTCEADLDQHPEVLICEGCTSLTGHVYLADRRPPRTNMPVPVSGSSSAVAPASKPCHLWQSLKEHASGTFLSSKVRASQGPDVAQADRVDDDQETHNANTQTAEPQPTASPRKRLGSYGPGAGWPSPRHYADWSDFADPGGMSGSDKRRN